MFDKKDNIIDNLQNVVNWYLLFSVGSIYLSLQLIFGKSNPHSDGEPLILISRSPLICKSDIGNDKGYVDIHLSEQTW